MLSLYLHIPFCRHKCQYCSFFVTPEELVEPEKMHLMKQAYTNLLLEQIATRKILLPDEQIRTLYIGGGTPFQLGAKNLIQVVETVFSTRDCSLLEELSIELNPDPLEEVLLFVQTCTIQRKDLFRVRFSFGIQSFDDAILSSSKREYRYDQLPDFFRALQKIKGGNVCYNADFIAFGNRSSSVSTQTPYLPRGEEQRVFFEKLVSSQLMDGFSIYTLELFPGSDRYNKQLITSKQLPLEKTNKDTVYDEFDRLATIVESNGYRRYELSNFSLAGKRSIHNMVYRTMGSYLGLGINASSLLTQSTLQNSPLAAKSLLGTQLDESLLGVRFSLSDQRKVLLDKQLFAPESLDILDTETRLRDECMLKLRTDQRITNTDRERYTPILEKNRKAQLLERKAQGRIVYDEGFGWQMSSYGLDLYNALITDLLVFASSPGKE